MDAICCEAFGIFQEWDMMTNQTSNKWKWPLAVIEEMARRGFKPFLGYWVRLGDDKLYLLREIRNGEYEVNP